MFRNGNDRDFRPFPFPGGNGLEMEMVLEMEMDVSGCQFGTLAELKVGRKYAKSTQLAEPVRSVLLFVSGDPYFKTSKF